MEPNQPQDPTTNNAQPEAPQVIAPQVTPAVSGPVTVSADQPAEPAQPSMPAFMQEPAAAPAASQPVAEASGRSVVKMAVIAVLVVGVFVGGYLANNGVAALNSSNAKSAGKAMVSALVAGNSQKAYGLASANLRSQESASALAQSVGDVQTSSPAYASENIQVNGDSAVYVADVDNLPPNDAGNTSGTFVVELAKAGVNSWKVDSVSVQ